MVSTTLIVCSFVVVCVGAVSGQEYSGRGPIRCPPVCAIHCEYGNVMHNGCPTCQCNPGPIIEPFPQPTQPVINRCQVMSLPATVCYPFSSTTTCPANTYCGGGPADEPGYCCRRQTQPNPNVHCPVDNSRTRCLVPMDYCSSRRPCPDGFKCCPRNCGKRCVPAQGALYRPGGGRNTRTA